MTRISDVTFKPAQTFEPTSLAKEFGNQSPDILASANSNADQDEGILTRMFCCVPRCALAIVKKMICMLTLGCCCNTQELSENERRELIIQDLQDLKQAWNGDLAPEDKKAMGKKVFEKHPDLKDSIVNFGINNERNASLALKRDPVTKAEKAEYLKKIREWNEKHIENERKLKEDDLDVKFNAAFIENYIKFLRLHTNND